MSADLIRAARAEEQRLRQELEATPIFRRLEAIRALLAEYDSHQALAANTLVAARVSLGKPRLSTHRASGMTARVIAATIEFLRTEQRRAQSAEILEALRKRELQITGSKPVAVVASILSHSDRFDNVRGEGYGLIEWSHGQTAHSDHSDDPVSGSDESGGDGSVDPFNETLDSRSELLSNGNWPADNCPPANSDPLSA